MMIEGHYDGHKARKITARSGYSLGNSDKQTWVIEVRTQTDSPRSNYEMTMYGRAKNSDVRAWIHEAINDHGEENITVLRREEAIVSTEFTLEDFTSIGCPCTICRNGLNEQPLEEYREKVCKAFRPQDEVNGKWRSELTDLELEGGPFDNREEYDRAVIVALAKHDAFYGGTEQAIEAQKEINRIDQINRTVGCEIRYMEEEANGERDAPKEAEHCDGFGTVCSDTYGKNIQNEEGMYFGESFAGVWDQGKKDDYGGRTGDWDFEFYGARYVVIFDPSEELQAYFFSNKAHAIKFFEECPADNSWMPELV